MCDTLGKLSSLESFFAKNSDRSPNEVQVLEFHRGQRGLTGQVECTYISIPQASQTYDVLLSRPQWMWGAEIGVNQWGLCIGNEAVFTKGAYGKTGLTGMDLLRLALERCKDARQAVDTIIALLQQYGQGGNCGYDHSFYYDNAFLIMDRHNLYVLETAGKQYAWRQCRDASISNRLSLGKDADQSCCRNFRQKFTEPVFTTFSGSGCRKGLTESYLPVADSLEGCMAALRSHKKGVSPFGKGSVASVCMHYGGLVGDHTTASMIVQLEETRTLVWSTGCSLPCVSLFKPWLFGSAPTLPVITPADPMGTRYWLEAEAFRRKLIGHRLPPAFYEERDAIQNRWISQASQVSDADFVLFSGRCLAEETEFYKKWAAVALEKIPCSGGFRSRWEKKNQALSK